MEPVDLLIAHADWLITVDSRRRIITDGAVAVRGDRIIAVGKTEELERRYQARKTLDARGKVVTPGLIDAHLHSSFQLSRGLADEVGSRPFLFERMYPYEGLLDEEDTYWSALLCVYESLRHGVTCFIDPGNYAAAATARAAEESGIRAIVAKSAMDVSKSAFGQLPPLFRETAEEGLERTRAVLDAFHGYANGRVRASVSFRGVNNCTDGFLQAMKRLADEYGVMIQAHACFAMETREASRSQYRMTEVERLHRLGILGPNLLLIHVGWATASELRLLRDHDVKIVVCASSSMHNGYGNLLMGHAPENLEYGVAVGLGSDHASSGIVDLPTEMMLAAGGYKEVRLDAAVLSPEQVVEMATINGARCALWDDEIGSIEVGKKADITVFDATAPEWQPLYNPLSNLVYSANGNTVDTVIVDGRIVVSGGRVLTIDREKLLDEVKRRSAAILERTGLAGAVRPRWPVE